MTNPLHHTTANNVTHYRSAILSAIGLALGALCFGSPANAASPEVYLEDSTVVGSGGTLAISRLQFTNGTTLQCDDVTIPFSVGTGGGLTVGAPTLTKCVSLITSHFVQGTYAGPGKAPDVTITVTGPGVGVGGSTVWSLRAATVDNNTPLSSARWVVGPLSDNPDAQAFLTSCKITPDPNASYGFGYWYFGGNVFVSMMQTNSAITAHGAYSLGLASRFTELLSN